MKEGSEEAQEEAQRRLKRRLRERPPGQLWYGGSESMQGRKKSKICSLAVILPTQHLLQNGLPGRRIKGCNRGRGFTGSEEEEEEVE